MNSVSTVNSAATAPAKAPAKPVHPKRGKQGPRTAQGSREAKRIAACILEVLGGARTPTDASKVLAITVPRYYQLETRALNGLLSACEPRAVGRVRSLQGELAQAQKEAERFKRESARYAALARLSQRTVGIAPPAAIPKKAKGKGKGQRRPTVRALKAVALLKVEPQQEEAALLAATQP